MPAEELSEVILNVIDGGKEISDSSKVIQFVADNGANIAQGTSNIISSGNGIINDVTAITESVGGTTATTGLGLLAIDVGVAGAAIAPALGILAGVGLYNLAPEFWTNVSNKLVEAGQTIGGKVHALLTDDGKVAYSKETIEIFKSEFYNNGLFNRSVSVEDPENTNSILHYNIDHYNIPFLISNNNYTFYSARFTNNFITNISYYNNTSPVYFYLGTDLQRDSYEITYPFDPRYVAFFIFSENPFNLQSVVNGSVNGTYSSASYTYRDLTVHFNSSSIGITGSVQSTEPSISELIARSVDANMGNQKKACWDLLWLIKNSANSQTNLQVNAIYPTSQPFPETYPDWQPITTPEYLPEYYPVELPTELPEQEQAQNPDEIVVTNPETWIEWITKNLPIPDPVANPQPEPVPQPDPDPQPEPNPLPEPDPAEEQKDPLNPNTDPTVPSTPLLPILPNTVSSNKLFTVYNPTLSQLNSLGAFLWSNDIIDALKKIWQDPLEGVISLRQVFCTPVVGNSSNIILGTLDSGVSSLVVTEQFVTQDCGTISLPEFFKNVSDYSPYTQLHLYLPFIGIVEINVNEFMNGTISITYHFDVYTGSVLTEVKCTRSSDMPSPTILYTFTGNASQALPITATNYQGAINATIGVATGALTLASGGGINPIFAMANMAHSVTHEMVHVNHASSLSGNAGIMGSRYPQLIVSRRKGYDANSYNDFYGYPTNKTVYLSNCSGYTRVKAIHFASAATQDEKNEIENLLKEGVIF